MKNENRNIRITAAGSGRDGAFHIYLSFSGQEEYLLTHRRSSDLFFLLKDSPSLADLRRHRPWEGKSPRRGNRLQGSLGHLLNVVDDYLDERRQAA